jgi:hypothetical protein
MNGQILDGRRANPLVPLVCIAAAVALIAVGLIERRPQWTVSAALPGFIGLFLLIAGGRRFYAELTEQDISFPASRQVVPYSEIDHLWTKDSRKNGSIYVYHQRGMFRLPVLREIATSDLYAFLRSATPQSVPRSSSRVANYFQTQLQVFGDDKVWAYVQRPEFRSREFGRHRLVGLALLSSGFVWLVGGIAVDAPWLFCTAIVLLVIGPVVWASVGSEANASLKKLRDSCLIVSPLGIALTQGELVGELRWEEVRSTKLVLQSSNRLSRIQLQVEGARIDLLDVYDSPLNEIYDRIMAYWSAG